METEVDQAKQISFWWQRIETATKGTDHQKHLDDKREARDFYEGKQISQQEEEEWGGDLIVANLFRRTVNFITDSVYSNDPSIKAAPRRRMTKDPRYLTMTEAIRTHLDYVYTEEDLRMEVKTTWKDAYFGNVAGVQIDFDKERGLWRAKWISGEMVCDPEAHGDTRRARWMAIRVQLPKYRIWQNSTFDKAARQELREHQSFGGDSEDSEGTEDGEKRTDVENVWYIYSKEGIEPLKNEDDKPKMILLVMAEGFDKWLLQTPNPCPYLDADEFPIEVLRIDHMPGKFNGPAMWRQVGAVCKAFNWAASYHMEDMRKTAGRVIAYDEDRVDDPSVLDGRTHMVKMPVTGDPNTVVAPVNVGQADKTIFDSVNFWAELLDKLTGIDEIARGEEGVQKTATESEILQKNSSITMQGPNEALDRFLCGMIKKIGLASIYYIPAFSVVVGPNGVIMTKQKAIVPEMDTITGMPMFDPMTNQPNMIEEAQEVPVTWEEEEAEQYGAQIDPMGVAITNPERQGEYLIKGIDYFHGDELALQWPDKDEIPYEQVKCDLHIKIEAGSSQASKRAERRRNAQALLATVGMDLKEIGAWEQYYEILTEVAQSFDIPDFDKKWITKEEFVALHQQQAALVMQAGQMPGGEGAPEAADPSQFDESNQAGTKYPSEQAG